MSELKATRIKMVYDGEIYEDLGTAPYTQLYYRKEEVDKVISELEADYKEACGRLQTANLIKDEQKAKADKLLSCLKYLVMRDLIKDCPPKKVAAEIVKECDNGLG